MVHTSAGGAWRATACARALKPGGALGILALFDDGVDLVLFYKYLLVLERNSGYEQHFDASDRLPNSQKQYAQAQLELFKCWYARWPGAVGKP